MAKGVVVGLGFALIGVVVFALCSYAVPSLHDAVSGGGAAALRSIDLDEYFPAFLAVGWVVAVPPALIVGAAAGATIHDDGRVTTRSEAIWVSVRYAGIAAALMLGLVGVSFGLPLGVLIDTLLLALPAAALFVVASVPPGLLTYGWSRTPRRPMSRLLDATVAR